MTVIDVFTWAFSLDLLGATSDRAGDGAIGPVAAAIASLYENVIGEAWMAAAIAAAGIWGVWKALVQRRYTQTAASLAVSVCFVLVALFFVYQPERTIGQASRWANALSLAFLSGANRGTVDDPARAKREVADPLFAAQVMQPWLALNFDGTRHASIPTTSTTTGSRAPSARTIPTGTCAATTFDRAATGTAATRRAFCSTRPGRRSAMPSTRRSRAARNRTTTRASTV